MDTSKFLEMVEGGTGVFTVEFHSDPKPAAAHKAKRLRKVSTALCMTGVEYAKLRVNKGVETGPLPWGEWKVAPYVIEHKGNDYARLYVVENGIRCIYTCDGEVVTQDEFKSYLTPSQASAKRPNGGTITVKMSGLRAIGEPDL